MKKYSVSHILSSDMWGIYCDGLVGDAETRQDAEHWRDILQAEHDEQAEEIATLKAALDASNAALAEAKKLIREVADNDVSIFKNMSDAIRLVESWDSAVAATTQDAPKQEVTLTEGEIEWMAKHAFIDDDGYMFFMQGLMQGYCPSSLNGELSHHDFHHPRPDLYVFHGERDTPANRAAIEARRKKASE